MHMACRIISVVAIRKEDKQEYGPQKFWRRKQLTQFYGK
jgi:hypothetical protein